MQLWGKFVETQETGTWLGLLGLGLQGRQLNSRQLGNATWLPEGKNLPGGNVGGDPESNAAQRKRLEGAALRSDHYCIPWGHPNTTVGTALVRHPRCAEKTARRRDTVAWPTRLDSQKSRQVRMRETEKIGKNDLFPRFFSQTVKRSYCAEKTARRRIPIAWPTRISARRNTAALETESEGERGEAKMILFPALLMDSLPPTLRIESGSTTQHCILVDTRHRSKLSVFSWIFTKRLREQPIYGFLNESILFCSGCSKTVLSCSVKRKVFCVCIGVRSRFLIAFCYMEYGIKMELVNQNIWK